MRQAKSKAADINLHDILKQVSREKEIDLDRWVKALEDAMASAAKKQHRIKEPVRASLDSETGQFSAFIVKSVVEEVEDPLAEWDLEEAREHKEDAEVGEEILLPISTEGLGRIAAQSAKQVLYQRIREAEREKIYNEYIGRSGEIVNGTVKRFERGDIIIDLGRTEAVVPRSEQSRHERYSQGERIRGVIVDVHTQPKGPQIVLSRTDPRLLVKLFEMEVPEIYDGTVIIKSAVRAPGERAKVAVYSRERDVDPVGACVGMKGSRVQSIIRELRGEKIDIIEHSDDLVTFAQSALAPAKITRVSVTHHGEYPHLDVIVEDEQLSLAIGKRGQNVRLASELIGAKIDIKSESDVKDEVADALARMLQSALGSGDSERKEDVDLVLTEIPGVGAKTAEAMQATGFGTLNALLEATAEDVQEVEGIGPKLAESILVWATDNESSLREGPPKAEEEADLGFELVEEPAAPANTMADDDFMAALSKAFQESEMTQARDSEPEAEESVTSEATDDQETEAVDDNPAEDDSN
ncbi:MAG: transcription termination factor NusA [Deltaproteobacteria bacterium]|nr:transcription termination factor NusA [Deltaproteobacteria bacterium]